MNNTTISQASRRFDISTRTLRYYEQLGLIRGIRGEDYAYRTYDDESLARIGQIVLLRKLRVPLSQIEALLKRDDVREAIAAFERHAANLTAEIDALDTVREVLRALIRYLSAAQPSRLWDGLLSDESVRALAARLAPEPMNLKEKKTMENLNRVQESLHALRDVRIVYLPPSTVASAHFIGPDPEDVAGRWIDEFVKGSGLVQAKPDLRLYGFNHPNPVDESNAHGYEFWVTVPDGWDVPAPLTKQHFGGGLYAAHMIRMGDFHEWDWLDRWVRENGAYAYRGDGNPENMFGALEEHLNYYTHITEGDRGAFQLDLLIPVKRSEGGL